MQPTRRPRVKVCGLQSADEAWAAIRYGASAIGLVSDGPGGAGVISEDRIREMARSAPPAVSRFLLTSRTDPAHIIDLQKRMGVDTLQLCSNVPETIYPLLRDALPGVRIVQVVHVTGPETVEQAQAVSGFVDALLLDSGSRGALTQSMQDWLLSRKIREAIRIPVFLGGGLTPKNVGEAIQRVGAYGIDVCSGIRNHGKLDDRLTEAFFEAVSSSGGL